MTVCFGGNDWEAGMRGEQFRRACADAIDRVRRATKGKADVLLLTTVPAAARWDDDGRDWPRRAARRRATATPAWPTPRRPSTKPARPTANGCSSMIAFT